MTIPTHVLVAAALSLATLATLATTTAAAAATAATTSTTAMPGDTPADYAWHLPLTLAGKQGVAQLTVPKDAYLHARSSALDDLRVFNAHGVALAFALRAPRRDSRTSHTSLPFTIFPLTGDAAAGAAFGLDVRADAHGNLVSVNIEQDRRAAPATPAPLAGLILDLHPAAGSAPPPIDALRFTLPPGQHDYSAQVTLETSNDLKQWDTAGVTELNWLVSQDAQTLANDQLSFAPRSFRYARLTWNKGTPLRFAAITGESPSRADMAPPDEQLLQLLLRGAPGKQAGDLVYDAPAGVAASKVGLQLDEANTVLPAQLGSYRHLPSRQLGQPGTWRFEPEASATFYRITQGTTVRASGDIALQPARANLQWVLRMAPPASAAPLLRLSWEPATLVWLADGDAPYTLAVGRDRIAGAARAVAQVAPGFSENELDALPKANAGPAIRGSSPVAGETRQQQAERDAGGAAQTRLLVLWAVLLLGVGVMAVMVYQLLRNKAAPGA